MREILFMTATIAPRSDTYLLARSKAEERLADYHRSLTLYLRHLKAGVFHSIVFAENSGASTESLAALAASENLSERVHFVSYVATEDPNKSRFFLELNLINTVLSHDLFSRHVRPEDRLWKLTGRYIIKNLAQIVRTAPVGSDMYINSRTIPKNWTDFFLAGFNQRAFQLTFARHLADYDNFTPGEEVLYDRLNGPERPPITVVQRMRRTPHLAGVRGYDGRRYDDLRGQVGYATRVAARVLAPQLWI